VNAGWFKLSDSTVKLFSIFRRRSGPAFRVAWTPKPAGKGWWLRWEPGYGESLVYIDPSDEGFVTMLQQGKRPVSFLGPFSLPVVV
jgi:hypothetical protein